MRTIKFRALYTNPQTNKSKMVYGDLVYNRYINSGMPEYAIEARENDKFVAYSIDPKTIGQFTGLKDCKGKEIFEGDLIGEKDCFVEVIFRDGAFSNPIDGSPIIEWIHARSRKGIDTEIIGNIYENEDLLK